MSTTSIRALEQLPEQIEITAYAREQAELRETIENFVGKYQRIKPDITLHFVNPDAVPDEIRNLGIIVNGEMVLRYQGKNEHIQKLNESDFSNALIRLTRQSEHWIAFIEGHGERNPIGRANHDLGEWGRQMINRGFKLQPLNLAEVMVIPDNTSVLVLTGSQIEFLPGEMQALLQYVNDGGNLFWLADPDDKGYLDAVADLLGVVIEDGMVIDMGGQFIGLNDPGITVITTSLYGNHPALSGLTFTTFFPKSAALTVVQGTQWSVQNLLGTADHSWLEKGVLNDSVQYDENTDQAGPLVIGLSLERTVSNTMNNKNKTKQQRIIIIGDGDFLSNTYVNNSGNMELGNRLISWLSHDDKLLDIPVPMPSDTQLTTSPVTTGIIGIFFLIILPLFLSAAGLFIWWRRRQL